MRLRSGAAARVTWRARGAGRPGHEPNEPWKTDVTPASPVKIYCGKSPVFRGSMGRHHDRVVVRIDGRVEG